MLLQTGFMIKMLTVFKLNYGTLCFRFAAHTAYSLVVFSWYSASFYYFLDDNHLIIGQPLIVVIDGGSLRDEATLIMQ